MHGEKIGEGRIEQRQKPSPIIFEPKQNNKPWRFGLVDLLCSFDFKQGLVIRQPRLTKALAKVDRVLKVFKAGKIDLAQYR